MFQATGDLGLVLREAQIQSRLGVLAIDAQPVVRHLLLQARVRLTLSEKRTTSRPICTPGMDVA